MILFISVKSDTFLSQARAFFYLKLRQLSFIVRRFSVCASAKTSYQWNEFDCTSSQITKSFNNRDCTIRYHNPLLHVTLIGDDCKSSDWNYFIDDVATLFNTDFLVRCYGRL